MAKIIGVDFSHWQANVNFDKLVANDIKFAIFKAGEIPTTSKREYTDDCYKRNIAEARRTGIISGAYYYFHPSMGASRQARHFDAVMQRDGQPDLPPVIDVEDNDQRTPAQAADVLKAMIDYLMGRGYRRPIIYSRWGFLVNQYGEPYWLKDHYLWLAQYSKALIYKPADMRNVIMWQFTDRMKLPGVGVALDGNYWLKSEEELMRLGEFPKPAAVVPPAAAPDPVSVEQPAPPVVSDPEEEELIPAGEPEQPAPTEAPGAEPVAPEIEVIAGPPAEVPQQPSQPVEQPESTPIEPAWPAEPQPQSDPARPTAESVTEGLWQMLQRLIDAIFRAWK